MEGWEKVAEKIADHVLDRTASAWGFVTAGTVYFVLMIPKMVRESAEAAMKVIEAMRSWRDYRDGDKRTKDDVPGDDGADGD